MAYFKITYRDETFKVVQANKTRDIPSSYDVQVDGTEWFMLERWNYNGFNNEWVFIWARYSKEKEFGGRFFKFNKTVHNTVSCYGVTGIEICSKDFYHQHKEVQPKLEGFHHGIRDGQKRKLYNAERWVKLEKKMSNYEVEEFVLEVLVSDVWSYFNQMFTYDKDKLVKLNLNPRATRVATGGIGGLSLPHWAKTRGTILHELAHVIIQRTFNYSSKKDQNIQAHGREYAFVYLYLVKNFAEDIYDDLVGGFDAWKVSYLTEFLGLSLGD